MTSQEIEALRKEFYKVLIQYKYDMSDIRVVKKAREVEDIILKA